jgi:hypothetical protein
LLPQLGGYRFLAEEYEPQAQAKEQGHDQREPQCGWPSGAACNRTHLQLKWFSDQGSAIQNARPFGGSRDKRVWQVGWRSWSLRSDGGAGTGQAFLNHCDQFGKTLKGLPFFEAFAPNQRLEGHCTRDGFGAQLAELDGTDRYSTDPHVPFVGAADTIRGFGRIECMHTWLG